MIYFGFRNLFQMAYISFAKRKECFIPFTFKRAVSLIVFFTGSSLVQLFNWICFKMDDLIYPEYRNIKIVQPVFIVGNVRTGTTFLHRVLSNYEDQFFSFKAWEIMFPAIVQKKVFYALGRLDRRVGGFLGKAVQFLEDKTVRQSNFYKMHQVGLFLPEEDDKLLLHVLAGFELLFLFPHNELDWLSRFDQLASPSYRRHAMTFYRDCIKRQAYCVGPTKSLLSKSPHSSSRIDALYEYFPDCKIIYTVRNPLEVIPSMMSIARELWHTLSKAEWDDSVRQKVYDIAGFYYTYPSSRLQRAPKESYAVVKYDDLIREPGQTIRAVWDRFDFEVTPKFISVLREEENKARSYRSKHIYCVEEFGLTQDQIVSDFRETFERFRFDTGQSPQTDTECIGGRQQASGS